MYSRRQRAANTTPADTPATVPDVTSNDAFVENNQQSQTVINVPNNEPLRRSQRARKPAIPDDYLTYMSEDTNEPVLDNDPTSFKEAMESEYSSKWLDAMKDEMKSMSTNDVWDLVEIPEGAKTVGCKWVYKTKRDSKGDIERFKARLVAKGFTQREGDMGTPNWAHSIDTPGVYSGEAHEELKVWKHPKPRNQIRKSPLGKPT